MPHSELLGRIPEPGEPRWTDRDRDLALGLMAWDESRHECGQPRAESFHPDNEDAYEASAVRCHACATGARFAKSFDGDTEGLSITVRKLP